MTRQVAQWPEGKWKMHTRHFIEPGALSQKTFEPKPSMYAIFPYIYHKKSTIHVGKYTIVPWMVWAK